MRVGARTLAKARIEEQKTAGILFPLVWALTSLSLPPKRGF